MHHQKSEKGIPNITCAHKPDLHNVSRGILKKHIWPVGFTKTRQAFPFCNAQWPFFFSSQYPEGIQRVCIGYHRKKKKLKRNTRFYTVQSPQMRFAQNFRTPSGPASEYLMEIRHPSWGFTLQIIVNAISTRKSTAAIFFPQSHLCPVFFSPCHVLHS